MNILLQAFKDLIAQQAYGIGSTTGCQYLTSQGNSCVIGLILKAHGTAPGTLRALHGSVSSPETRRVLEAAVGPLNAPAIILLSAAQELHDYAARSGEKAPTKDALIMRLAKLATMESPSTVEEARKLLKHSVHYQPLLDILEQLP